MLKLDLFFGMNSVPSYLGYRGHSTLCGSLCATWSKITAFHPALTLFQLGYVAFWLFAFLFL